MLGPGIVHCLWLYSCLVSLSFICIHQQPASRQLAASSNYVSRLLSTASSFPASILMTASLTGGVRNVTEVISNIVTHVAVSSSQTQLRTERETAAAVVQSAVTNLITAAARDAVLAPACVLQMSPAVRVPTPTLQ